MFTYLIDAPLKLIGTKDLESYYSLYVNNVCIIIVLSLGNFLPTNFFLSFNKSFVYMKFEHFSKVYSCITSSLKVNDVIFWKVTLKLVFPWLVFTYKTE